MGTVIKPAASASTLLLSSRMCLHAYIKMSKITTLTIKMIIILYLSSIFLFCWSLVRIQPLTPDKHFILMNLLMEELSEECARSLTEGWDSSDI